MDAAYTARTVHTRGRLGFAPRACFGSLMIRAPAGCTAIFHFALHAQPFTFRTPFLNQTQIPHSVICDEHTHYRISVLFTQYRQGYAINIFLLVCSFESQNQWCLKSMSFNLEHPKFWFASLHQKDGKHKSFSIGERQGQGGRVNYSRQKGTVYNNVS